MAQRVPARLTPREGRRFAFPVGAAFLTLSGLFWWRGHHLLSWPLVGIGGSQLLAGALVPTLLGPIQRGWMAFGHAVSKVTTPVFMAIVYFLVISPIALARRTFGRNPIRHRPEAGTYWQKREEGSGKSDLSRQF